MALKDLFPIENAAKKNRWSTFQADGYNGQVTGVVYRSNQAVCGLPLGGIATGAVDLGTDGTLGRCTCYNSIIPPRELGNIPFLAVGVGNDVWALTTQKVEGVKRAKQVYYWGHYPVADVRYEIEAPVKVSLRAWSPFIPGDAEISNTPAMVFEVRLKNTKRTRQKGTLAISFPGPTHQEAGRKRFTRQRINRATISAVNVNTGNQTGYTVSVLKDAARFGGELIADSGAYADIATALPDVDAKTTGTSAAVDFDLKAGQQKIIRFVISWYYPILASPPHAYLHAYGPRFKDSFDVANRVSQRHESLLKRIIAWQQVIYNEAFLPGWLRDCLINSLYLLAEDAFWEANSLPPEDWAEETGMYSMVESTRTCPGQSCIPSDFYGNFPVVYFFPKLALSTLRGFANLQRPNGEIPIYWGQNYERQNPVYQLLHVTSPINYVDLVDRLWRRSGDDSIVHEFYTSVKSAIGYLQSLDKDADGIVDCHPNQFCAHQFYNAWNWTGAAVHVAGMWLSALYMAERMAQKVGDPAFAKDCRIWLNLGKRTLEEKLWNGKYYRVFNDTEKKRKSETILSNQLIGQWCSKLHGTEDVFPQDKVKKVFNVIKKKCVPKAKYGAAGAIQPNGKIDHAGGETSEGTFTPECLILAMTMLYCGDKKTGQKIAKETMHNLVIEQGLQWDLPNTIDTETGQWLHGNDFDQMMIVWSLPAALLGHDLSEASGEGSFVEKILQAGNAK